MCVCVCVCVCICVWLTGVQCFGCEVGDSDKVEVWLGVVTCRDLQGERFLRKCDVVGNLIG